MGKDDVISNQAAKRPQVPYAQVLDSDNLAECPTDQYHLIQIIADLEYSRDHKGGSVVRLPVRLAYCPVCKTWYIDHLRLADLARQGVDLSCIDLIGSASYPRPDAYLNWHPLPVPAEPASQPTPVRQVNAKSGGAKAAGRRSVSPAKPKAHDLNLAFNCLYCDGGTASPGQIGHGIGYRGVCTQDCYYGNITRYPEAWCADSKNRCRDFRPDELPSGDGLCYECRLLHDWAVIRTGDRPDHSHVGGVVVLTTVFPRESEAYRRVIAVFSIADQSVGTDGMYYAADKQLRFELQSDEPVYFWKAMSVKGQADSDWNGNCRSVNHPALVRILHRSMRAIKDAERRAVAGKMLERASAVYSEAQLAKIIG